MLRKFIEKLLYYNKKVIVFENNGNRTNISVSNIDPDESIMLAALSVCELINRHCKYYNLGYRDKVDIVRSIIEMIGERTGVDININKED